MLIKPKIGFPKRLMAYLTLKCPESFPNKQMKLGKNRIPVSGLGCICVLLLNRRSARGQGQWKKPVGVGFKAAQVTLSDIVNIFQN